VIKYYHIEVPLSDITSQPKDIHSSLILKAINQFRLFLPNSKQISQVSMLASLPLCPSWRKVKYLFRLQWLHQLKMYLM
jgi:hypothetical protein